MVAVKKSGAQNEPPSRGTFPILYRSGAQDHVLAHSFAYQPKQGDIIKFFDSETDETGEIFLRAPEVASVIAYSRMVEGPLVFELQSQVKNLETRMDALEKNLVDIVASALDVVLKKRGVQLITE
jgi:hypothetical protein